MTNPVPSPAHPSPAAADRPARTGVLRGTAVVATVAVVVALVGIGLLLLPVRTPAADCGTAYSYLFDGRYDVPIDPGNPPEGVTAAEAEANNAEPCHDRVVDKARPAAYLIAGGTVVAVIVVIVEGVVRTTGWVRRRPPRGIPTAP